MKFLPPPSQTAKKGTFSFPHISRIFSAGPITISGRKMLWSLLTVFLLTNVYAAANYEIIEWEKLIPMLQAPLAASNHVALARTLESEGRISAAHQEMRIAYDLGLPVLGAATEHDDAATLPYWNSIASQYPLYRDAHLILAWLYYKQGDMTRAKMEADAARALDPINESAQKLLNLLGK